MKFSRHKKQALFVFASISLCCVIGYTLLQQSYTKVVASNHKIEVSFQKIVEQSDKRLEKTKNLIQYLEMNQLANDSVTALKQSYDLVKSAQSKEEIMTSDSALTTAIFRTFAQMKSTEHGHTESEAFQTVCTELYEINEKMSQGRRVYNDCVIAYNTLLSKFPARAIAEKLQYEDYTAFTMGSEGKMAFKMDMQENS